MPRPDDTPRMFARAASSDGYGNPLWEQEGITYRQWLIGLATQGLLMRATPGTIMYDAISYHAIAQVDDLLQQMEDS